MSYSSLFYLVEGKKIVAKFFIPYLVQGCFMSHQSFKKNEKKSNSSLKEEKFSRSRKWEGKNKFTHFLLYVTLQRIYIFISLSIQTKKLICIFHFLPYPDKEIDLHFHFLHHLNK